MVNYESIDRGFAALADPTRRQMLERLARGEATISELAAPHAMSMPAAMKHVSRLVEAGMIRREKRGRSVVCSLQAGPLDEAARWLTKIYEPGGSPHCRPPQFRAKSRIFKRYAVSPCCFRRKVSQNFWRT